ncbi:hypothetical protein BSFA1_43860 [Burkholderia sp. SFA1]|uniref:hypothetical protein n=1 Tax=unclassified Caballeronia TaxID=2646786 RepID=UPI001F286AAB|nr:MULTISPECIES: hypothetical protein [unclassified Caballeronia]MCE4545474.1 hypothetical protein [Caballeronia sp. PC1]MCE4570900.1 hypothetical protein [Caballeronia sp. CLC5]BBP99257.1 hypothetical protein BSFA1_43860 [Burkholderia sp. SFA1]
MRRIYGGALCAWSIAFAALVASPAVSAADAPAASAPGVDIKPAERLLFMQSHMDGVEPQTELDYAVDYSGPPSKVNDTLRVLVVSPGNSKNDARVTDRTGNVNVPGGLPCNPVIIYFLEHDIAEMEQLTGGQRRYFQQRVRMALAAGPQITTVSSEALGLGKHPKAQQIVIQPYLNDPNSERFSKYTGKRYTFVMADDVPGRLLMIRTEVPGEGNDFAHPLQKETIAYQGALKNMGSPKASNGPRASR